jgi:alpha-D-xyloside xylohydrolase
MLVAPVMYEDVYQREVYLPAGVSWTELSTKRVYEGGQCIIADAPIDTIPVFLKAGKRLGIFEENGEECE